MMHVLLLSAVLAGAGCVAEKNIARARAQVDLGAAYFREGSFENAVETLREATKLDPRNWRAWNALALTYAAKGDQVQARDAFDRALRLNGEEGEILVNFGAWQVKQGESTEAIATFEKAAKDLDYRNQALVLSNLSVAYLSASRADEALAAAREAVRRTPTLCEGWFHVGLAQEARSDADAAVEAYKELISRCPGEASGARLRLGCLQVRGPLPELGIRPLEQVLSDMPGTPMADQARDCLRAVAP